MGGFQEYHVAENNKSLPAVILGKRNPRPYMRDNILFFNPLSREEA